jgi:hypothetical protein
VEGLGREHNEPAHMGFLSHNVRYESSKSLHTTRT